jgi:hypothetical protein
MRRPSGQFVAIFVRLGQRLHCGFREEAFSLDQKTANVKRGGKMIYSPPSRFYGCRTFFEVENVALNLANDACYRGSLAWAKAHAALEITILLVWIHRD